MLSVLTLKSEKTDELYDVLRKKTHSVARAGFKGDFEIPSDSTVSRSHAEISLVKKVAGRNVNMLLEVVDKNSKFGTFINSGISLNEQIDSDRSAFLKEGDRIRFGVMDSIWTVVKYPIVVCPSTLKRAEKEILRNLLSKMGGQVSNDWTEQCTHLCMNSITVTEKVLVCLASAKSIVPLKYFIDLCEALSPNSTTKLSFFMDYKPILAESLLNPSSVSLDVDNKRKKLFLGKTFICSSDEQLNRVSKIIKTAGGEIINYFDANISEDTILNSKEHIFLQQDLNNTENRSKIYKQILEKLKMMNKRPISENDVGLAVIFKSTEKHCNPYYDISLVNLQSQSNVIKSQTSMILAHETEVLTVNDNKIMSSVNVVPDSVFETQSHVKRPLEVIMDSDEILIPKKRAMLSNNSLNNDTELVVTQVIEPTPSNSNCTFKPSEPKKTVIDDIPFERAIESTSYSNNYTFKSQQVTQVIEPTPSSSNSTFTPSKSNKTLVDDVPFERGNEPTSSLVKSSEFKNTVVGSVPVYSSSFHSLSNYQRITKKNDISDWLQPSNDVNSKDTKIVDNKKGFTKRKNPSFSSMLKNNEDDDPFGYMDLDEIEENPKKKSKVVNKDSEFFKLLATSNNINEQPKSSVEPKKINNVVDPNFIMNLLADAKGTGQFIDASKLLDKSSKNASNDYESSDLINSVIVETVDLVITRPFQTQNRQQENSTLNNFKKFKRKGPGMRIPHIIAMEED